MRRGWRAREYDMVGKVVILGVDEANVRLMQWNKKFEMIPWLTLDMSLHTQSILRFYNDRRSDC